LIAFALLIAGVAAFCVVQLTRDDPFLVNTGFLLLGALIAIFTSFLRDAIKERQRARDLGRVLYVELADRVARCCLDFHTTWRAYLGDERFAAERDAFDLRKFIPAPAIIFPATASQLAILGSAVPQTLIRFYYCLAAWGRDLENRAADAQRDNNRNAEPAELRTLANRLRETLDPGLRALEAFAGLIEARERVAIDADALNSYYGRVGREPLRPTLLESLRGLIA